MSLPRENGDAQDGIRLAWAREKIASLMQREHDSRDEVSRDAIRAEIVQTSIEHHLVSRYTSLVAVDVTPVNGSGVLFSEKLKTMLPHGSQAMNAAPAMMLAQTATGATLHLLRAFALVAIALLILLLYRRIHHAR